MESENSLSIFEFVREFVSTDVLLSIDSGPMEEFNTSNVLDSDETMVFVPFTEDMVTEEISTDRREIDIIMKEILNSDVKTENLQPAQTITPNCMVWIPLGAESKPEERPRNFFTI